MNDVSSSCLSALNENSVEVRLANDGSPEIRRHWKRFKKTRIPISDIQFDELRSQFRSHSQPLFGHPILFSLMLLPLSSMAAIHVATTVSLQTQTTLLSWLGGALAFAGSGFLLTYLSTLIQRRIIWPMEPLLAKSIALALCQKDYRSWWQQQSSVGESQAAIQASGVSGWDDPSYCRWYQREDDDYTSVPLQSEREQLRNELLKFLGTKDPIKRKHIPGPFQSHLVKDKKSVTRFVKAHQEELIELREGTLPIKDAWNLLRRLRGTEVEPNSRGANRLDELLANEGKTQIVPEGIVQVQVWQRDPWQDLCSQTDFYSSASLRGVQAVGRSTKGRLSPFQYLDNPSISAVDFSDRRGRAVRARLGLCWVQDEDSNTDVPAVFVDGVEGSNRISPNVILRGLLGYAEELNIAAILFYQFPHNSIPRRFVDAIQQNELQSAGATGSSRSVSIRYFQAESREYLDAFGWPVEPFEYAYPKGRAIAQVVGIGDKNKQLRVGRTPRFADRLNVFAKRNCLWMILGASMSFASLMIMLTAPWMMIPLIILVGLGVGLHLKTQRMGIEAKE